ncbi:MAG: asparaginase, partial [Bowdeniella nasicola]|nr:asparaginase [Bowdeniella nasicola]
MTTIAIGALGGTIAMTPDSAGGGVKPSLDADDLVAAVPELNDIATITAKTIASVASPNLQMGDVLAAYRYCCEQAEAGVDGIVLTHGTDTLEETAYFLDLLWDYDIPIVITGAMRSPNLPSADGPGNILAAVVAAASTHLTGLGVLVVLNDEVHLARFVAKTNSTATWTFASPGWGPIARIAERRASVMLTPRERPSALPVPPPSEIRIPVIECGLSD